MPRAPIHAGPVPPPPSAPWQAAQPARAAIWRPSVASGDSVGSPAASSPPHAATATPSRTGAATMIRPASVVRRRGIRGSLAADPGRRRHGPCDPRPGTRTAARESLGPPAQRRSRRRRRRRRTPRSTARPHAATSPSRSAATAGSRSPAGHGSSASQRGPRRSDVRRQPGAGGPVPGPRAWPPARSARRRAPTASAPSTGRAVISGTPGSHRPSGSATASIDPGLVGDEHLGHEQAVGPAAHRRAQAVEVDGRAAEPPAANVTSRRPHAQRPGSTSPLVTSGGPSPSSTTAGTSP